MASRPNKKGAKKKVAAPAGYFVYLLECADGTLYAGSTNDVQKRLKAHNGQLPGGARYTSGRRPVTLRYSEACIDRSTALKREIVLKNLNRTEKLLLIRK